MKRHWILGVLWLFGCGAASPTDDGADSTLESSLASDNDRTDDDTSNDLSDSELASEFIPNSDAEDAPEASDTPEASNTPEAGDSASTAATPTASASPQIVIGAGGEAWQQPEAGVVVWCHASVPLGCPALEPAPSGGRLVVVQRSLETGEFEQEEAAGDAAPAVASASAAAAPASDAAPYGSAAPGTAPAPGVSRPALPVEVGASLPPLPGTCVAITFASGAGASAEPASGTSVPGVPATAATSASAAGHAGPVAGEPAAGAQGAGARSVGAGGGDAS
ncbi:MAG TPA: hypothetical protein VMG12_33170, partial [Polyangiaceae bacterium]|nr:hypothetical protein [Polyangiaceae bacterium]